MKQQFGVMNLLVMSGDKACDAIPLSPVQQLRLMAFAQTNEMGLSEMIELCINYAIAPESDHPKFYCPEEQDILDFAMRLMSAGKKAKNVRIAKTSKVRVKLYLGS